MRERERDEDVEPLKVDSERGQKINRRDSICVVVKKRLPRLAGAPVSRQHVFGDGRLGEAEASL